MTWWTAESCNRSKGMKGILEALHDGVTAAYRLRNLSRVDAHLLHSRE
jgi:hypothetical protein